MPCRPAERQYRDFTVRSFQPEVRESSDEPNEQNYTVRGYFCTFREAYPLFRDYYEEIDPHAFDGCDMSDVIMQANHSGHVYARTRNGSLKITFDDHGGHCVADLSGSKQGREDLYEAITNGLVDRMSFGFTIADDGLEWEEDDQGVIHTRITKVSKLYDVSAIEGFPANEGTEISARSLYDSVMEAREKADELKGSDEPETRSSDTDDVDCALVTSISEEELVLPDGTPVIGEVEDFSFDIEDIARRVAEIIEKQARGSASEEDEPEDSHQDDEQGAEQSEEERAIVDETLKRRQRRARAMRLATI